MPYFTVHYNKDGMQLHAVDMEAATGEAAVAEIRREITLCHPGGTVPEVIGAQFRDFRFEGSAEPPKAEEVCG